MSEPGPELLLRYTKRAVRALPTSRGKDITPDYQTLLPFDVSTTARNSRQARHRAVPAVRMRAGKITSLETSDEK